MKKICKMCLIEKDVSNFHKSRKDKDGYFNQCKECRKIKSKNDYYKKKQRNKLIIKCKICTCCLVEKDINSFHKHISSKDGYRSMCKECRSNKFKTDYQNSSHFSSTHRKRTKQYVLNNREKVNEYFKLRYTKKHHEYAWRGMLSSVIRRFGSKKESSTYQLLGYSAEQLKKHMENLFTDGMSWDNWGEWHIDHIIPVSSFDKNTDSKIVNDLTNLQPLWSKDNIVKGKRV